MATTISQLKTIFSADTSRYKKGVKSASTATMRFNKVIGGVNSKLVGMAAGFAGAAVAGLSLHKVISDVREQFNKLDAIGKQSDNLGISPEFIQTLNTAAGLTGTSIGTLDAALIRFVRRVGEAKEGNGKAVKGFEQLGISIDSIVNDTPEQTFLRIAESIRAIEDPTQKASAAYAFFGRQGIQLINLLNQGEAGINKVREALSSRGGLFNRAEIAQVEQANDAMLLLNQNWDAFTQRLAITAAPVVERIAAKMDGMAQSMSESGQNSKAMSQNLAIGVDLIEKAGIFLMLMLKVMQISLFATVKWTMEAISWVIKQANNVPGIDIATNDLDMIISDTGKTVDEISSSIDNLVDNFWKPLGEQIESDNPVKELNADTEQAIKLQDDLTKSINKREQSLKSISDKLLGRRIAAEESLLTDNQNDYNRFMSNLYDKDNGLNQEERDKLYKEYQHTVKLEQDALRIRAEQDKARAEQERKKQERERKLEEMRKQREAKERALVSKAESLKQSLLTPLQIATGKIKEIYELRDKGLLTDSQAEQLARKQAAGVAAGESSTGTVGAISMFTQASSAKLATRASLGITKTQQIERKQLNETKRTNDILSDIKTAIDNDPFNGFSMAGF